MQILFLCTGNSCRSIIAEALLRAQRLPGVTAGSAGSNPVGAVNPRALTALRDAGIPTDGLASKSWHDLPAPPDVVITLCGAAEQESCPAYFGDVIRSHWGMPDPAQATGTDAAIAQAFAMTLQSLRDRIDALSTLLAAQPDLARTDRQAFAACLDSIAVL